MLLFANKEDTGDEADTRGFMLARTDTPLVPGSYTLSDGVYVLPPLARPEQNPRPALCGAHS